MEDQNPVRTRHVASQQTQNPKSDRRTDRFDLRALYETSRLLSASLDLEFVLENLLRTAMSKLLVTRGAVLLWEPVQGSFRVACAKGRGMFGKGDSVAMEAMPGEKVLENDDLPPPLKERSMDMALPIAAAERKIGWLALGSKATGEDFTEAEIEFVISLVGMSATAVNNALLVEDLQEANRDLDGKVQELNTLFDLSQEFNATVDRARLAKLLSFALMGQMAVRKHLFLLRPSGAAAEDNAPPFQEVAAKGVAGVDVTPALTEAVCSRRELVRLADEGEAPWQALREAGLEILLPIRHQEETCAALALGPKMTGKPYVAGDIEFLYALGNLAFVSIQNAHLVEEQIEMERLEKEMRLARDIQERLLPQQVPATPGIEVAARALPSREVGGDYYDIMTMPGSTEDLERRRLLIALADVTGKGVPAALLMANLQAGLKALVPMGLSIDDMTARLNRLVCENTDPGTFITFFVALYDPDAHTLDYVNAGHNPPMLVRDGGDIEELGTGGLLLGVMSGASYERARLELAAGDMLAIFTDGATEAMNPDEEEYGEERLKAFLRAHGRKPAAAVLQAVYDDIDTFAEHPEFLSDDLTMIVLQVSGLESNGEG